MFLCKFAATKAARLPLRSYEDRSAFKIYCVDVGLLGEINSIMIT